MCRLSSARTATHPLRMQDVPVLFYGVPAGCSFGSIVALEWLGEPYRLCRIEMLEHPWPELFARVNPLNKTPALLTARGDALAESAAILQHIAARDPNARPGTPEFDRLAAMLSFLVTDFFSAFSPLWLAFEGAGIDDAQRAFLRERGRRDVGAACAYLDDVLRTRRWLLGDRRTVADAYLAGVARWIEFHELGDVADAHPNFRRYREQLRAEPAVAFAQAIEDGALATSSNFRGHVTLDELRPRLAA